MRAKFRKFKLITKIILGLITILIVITNIIQLYPSCIGTQKAYIVMGDSMRPTFYPGDLIFIKKVPTEVLKKGDIITVKANSRVYTHRIIGKSRYMDGIAFNLKGDANDDPDIDVVYASDIIGKEVFSIPTRYLYTKLGFTCLVIAPLLSLTFLQILEIYKIYDTGRMKRSGLKTLLLGRRSKRGNYGWTLSPASALLLVIVVAGSTQLMAPYYSSVGGAFFTDTEKESINSISAATWRVQSSLTCHVSNETVPLDGNVTVYGCLDPDKTGVEIELEYSCNGTVMGTNYVETLDGDYEEVFFPSVPGKWSVRANWEGNRDYYGDESEVVEFEVLEDSTVG